MKLSAARRRELLRSMLRIRLVEEAIARRYPEGLMRCPVHLSVGQEACAVGVCEALRADDWVLSTHRCHAHYLAKGGDLRAMLAELHGRAAGSCGGKGGSMHLRDLSAGFLAATPIVGSSLPVAVGAAFGSWLDGARRVTAVFLGEATTEEGVFPESLNFAALKKLPVVFVCENNGYSVYSPLDVRQPKTRDLVALARAHGVEGRRLDGNDVEAVYAAAESAVARARAGRGPSFLELTTYRWLEHCGPNFDNHIGYRTEAEFKRWKKRCPVEGYAGKLERAKVFPAAERAEAEREINREIDEAFAFAKASPAPAAEALAQDLFA